MAEAMESADTCNRSSSGTSNVLSRSLSRNLARNAAVLGGRSVSIIGNRPAQLVGVAKLGLQLFYPVACLNDAAESHLLGDQYRPMQLFVRHLSRIVLDRQCAGC